MSTIAFSDLLGLKDVVFKIIELFKERKNRLDEQHKTALDKLYIALNETKFYLADFYKGKRDRDQEKAISSFWREASLSLRNVDVELADKCFLKMDYWSDPDDWTQKEIRKAKIDIDQVLDETRFLIKECKK